MPSFRQDLETWRGELRHTRAFVTFHNTFKSINANWIVSELQFAEVKILPGR